MLKVLRGTIHTNKYPLFKLNYFILYIYMYTYYLNTNVYFGCDLDAFSGARRAEIMQLLFLGNFHLFDCFPIKFSLSFCIFQFNLG